MCGKPVAFRQDRPKTFRGYASFTHARRSLKEYRWILGPGKAKPFRTSGGRAAKKCHATLAKKHALRFQQTFLRAPGGWLRPAFAFVGPADAALGGPHV